MKKWIPQFTHHKQCTIRVFIKTVWPYFFFFLQRISSFCSFCTLYRIPPDYLSKLMETWYGTSGSVEYKGLDGSFTVPLKWKPATQNINEKKKLKQIQVNTELPTKIHNSHISLVGTICNFLTPPAKVCGLGFRGWILGLPFLALSEFNHCIK